LHQLDDYLAMHLLPSRIKVNAALLKATLTKSPCPHAVVRPDLSTI